jgi:mannitol/fructose-specific phosphotransferase system IIA component (Ntr-type)
VQRLQFALGRTASAIPWGGKGSRLIRLIFLIAVPATDAAGYLNLLATLARLGHRAEVLEELRVAQGVDAMMRALEKAEE